jgi:hypothetical protein
VNANVAEINAASRLEEFQRSRGARAKTPSPVVKPIDFDVEQLQVLAACAPYTMGFGFWIPP